MQQFLEMSQELNEKLSEAQALFNGIVEKSKVKKVALTKQEQKVFELIEQGKSTEEIAKALGRSARTIEVYRANIRKRMNVGRYKRFC